MIIHEFDLKDYKQRNQLIREVNQIIPFKEVFLQCPACLNYIFKDATSALTFVFNHTENDEDGLTFDYVSAEIGYNQPSNHFYCHIVTTYGSYMLKTTDSLRYGHPIASGIVDESDVGIEPEFLSPVLKEEANQQWQKFRNGIKKVLTEKKQDEQDIDIIKRILLNKLVNRYLDEQFGRGVWKKWHLQKNRIDGTTVEYVLRIEYTDQYGMPSYRNLQI
jgi:hypothetical protein